MTNRDRLLGVEMLIPMSPTDSLFLTFEARQRPMHVGGLQLYVPPPGAGSDFAQELFASWTKACEVAPLFRKRPARSLTTAGQWGWEDDPQFDIEYHVRHNALPRPGRILELLALCSRLHGTMLDRGRPLWEAHLIEGLADGRFAAYFKIHHSLLDGMSAARLLQSVLSTDPDERGLPAPWAVRTPRPRPIADTVDSTAANSAADTAADRAAGSVPNSAADVAAASSRPGVSDLPASLVRSAVNLAGEALGMPRAFLSTVRHGLREEPSSVSFSAPKTIFNVPITGSRRFAAQAWPLSRLRAVGKGRNATLNDVVLAMCSGALRSYLQGLDALPDSPLIAMVPVALRARDLQREGGNAVGAVMCNLGTHLPDAEDRLDAISHSMTEGKAALSKMSPFQILAMSALGTGPLLLQSLPGVQNFARPPFNLIISNVPGPKRPLYLDGARLDGMFPLSVPFDGQALNITCSSYAGDLAFGLTGCRRSVPHLQRLLGHLDDSLEELEKAVAA